jgi:hypothetical protein
MSVRPGAVPPGRTDPEPALVKINIRPSKSKHLSLTKPESAIAYRTPPAILTSELVLALLDRSRRPAHRLGNANW